MPDTLCKLSHRFQFSLLGKLWRWVFLQFTEEEMDTKRPRNVPKVTELLRGGAAICNSISPTCVCPGLWWAVPCTATQSNWVWAWDRAVFPTARWTQGSGELNVGLGRARALEPSRFQSWFCGSIALSLEGTSNTICQMGEVFPGLQGCQSRILSVFKNCSPVFHDSRCQAELP